MAFAPLLCATLLRKIGKESVCMLNAKLVLLLNVQPTTRGSDVKIVMPLPALVRMMQLVTRMGGALSNRRFAPEPPAADAAHSKMQFSNTVLVLAVQRMYKPRH